MKIFLLALVEIQDSLFKKLPMTIQINNKFFLTFLKKSCAAYLKRRLTTAARGVRVGVHNTVPENSGVFTQACLQWRPWVYTNTADYIQF